MKRYEIGFILQPNMSEEDKTQTIDKLKAIYTNAGCEIVDEVNLGMKELAYEIEKKKTGHYFFFLSDANAEVNNEFERICRIDENVIRFMVVNVDDVRENTLDILRKA